MKKVLLIGKINENMQNIYTYLSSHYSVQLSLDDEGSVKNMLKMNRPDLIMIFPVGFDKKYARIFHVIHWNCGSVPLIIMGDENEYQSFCSTMNPNMIHYLERSAGNERILSECRQYLEVRQDIDNFFADELMRAGKKLILIVDDSALTLRSLKGILEPAYKTVLVTNGAQAVSQIERYKPDLIILDYEMPVCNGRRILKLLKATEKTKDIPVIFLTGVYDKDNIMAVLKLNPAGYFLKPPDAKKLLNKIHEVLGD